MTKKEEEPYIDRLCCERLKDLCRKGGFYVDAQDVPMIKFFRGYKQYMQFCPFCGKQDD